MEEKRRLISSILTLVVFLILLAINLPIDSLWDYIILFLFILSFINFLYSCYMFFKVF